MSARSSEQGTRGTKKKKRGCEGVCARVREAGGVERTQSGTVSGRSAGRDGSHRARNSAIGGKEWRTASRRPPSSQRARGRKLAGRRARALFFFFFLVRHEADCAQRERRAAGASGGGGSGSSREAPPRRRRGAQLRMRAFARTSSRSHHRRPSRPRPGPPPPPRSRRALRGAKKSATGSDLGAHESENSYHTGFIRDG